MTKNDKKLAGYYWQLGNEYRELAILFDPEVDTPTPPDANVRLEILAKAFLHDTGIVSPHEIQTADADSPGYSFEERQNAWHKWLKENDVPEPTPDALVEAVKQVKDSIINIDESLKKRHTDIPPGLAYQAELLERALAAHKKAVR